MYAKIFVIAHACKLNTQFDLTKMKTPGNTGKIRLYFKADDNTCVQSDATQIDLDANNYKNKESQQNPRHLVDDYSLTFRDPIQDFGLNTFGIFAEDGTLLPVYNTHEKLSDVIKIYNELYQTTKFYLHICRTKCEITPKKKRKSKKSKGGKHKKRISIKIKNKSTLLAA
jgi:hypothetical protein